jgi:hypothetical protein
MFLSHRTSRSRDKENYSLAAAKFGALCLVRGFRLRMHFRDSFIRCPPHIGSEVRAY